MKTFRLLALAAWLPALALAQSFSFRAIGDAPAIMYDGPTQRSAKRFIAPPGMPVEVVHVSGSWSKVRDVTGDMAWVETRDLGTKRTAIVTVQNARIRAHAEESAPITFTAGKGVLLEIAEPAAAGWVKVRHRDGQTGYIRAADVWGD